MTDWIKEMLDEYGIHGEVTEPETSWRTVPTENIDAVRGMLLLMFGDRVRLHKNKGEVKQTGATDHTGAYILMRTGIERNKQNLKWHLQIQRVRDMDNGGGR